MNEKFIISIRNTDEHAAKIKQMQEERLKTGYPKIGTVLTAIKSGNTHPTHPDGPVTKGKQYIVFNNGDLHEGYYHVTSDEDWFHVRLTPEVLREFFGWDMNA